MIDRNFLTGRLAPIVMWPVLGVVLCITIWLVTVLQLRAEKDVIEQHAMQHAASLSRAYAQFLLRIVDELEVTSDDWKYDSERSGTGGEPGLQGLRKKAPAMARRSVRVVVYGKKGNVLYSTLKPGDTFAAQRALAEVLRHESRGGSRLSFDGNGTLYLSRRLELEDGTFSGIIAVIADPVYLGRFYAGSDLGDAGLLAIAGADGVPLFSWVGESAQPPGETPLQGLALPLANGGSAEIAQLEATGHAREEDSGMFAGWQSVGSQPFFAVVGLSKAETLRPYNEIRRIYLSIAGGLSGLLLAAIAVLSVLSVRLAYRQYQADGIQQAYRMATEGTSDGFYILTAVRNARGTIVDFMVVDCNEAGAGFFGTYPDRLIGRRLTGHPDASYFRWMIQTCAAAMEAGHSDEEVELPEGNPMRLSWVRRRLVRCGDGLAVTLQDIGQRKLHEQDLLRLGNEDALTGLPNRHWLGRYLPPAIARANAKGGMLALLAVDLDGFKEINDTHGHADGDEMLRNAAKRLSSVLRATDRLVHLGGDEFAVLLMPVERESKIVLTASRIAELFEEPFQLGEGTRKMGVSVGISLFPRDGGDTETLLKNADIAMQAVKMSGKGHCRFYKPELYETIRKRRRIEQELGEALISEQLEVYYQPRADTHTGVLCSMEALVRWVHPQRGMVLPLEFIPVAESTGLITVLGDFVIEKVCAQIAIWTAARMPVVPVSINVSAHQFERGDLPRVLAAAMEKYGVDPRLVEVELTESAMMGDHSTVVEQLAAIRAQGVKLLVDDFGTGYSSLAQLQRFEMDGLKIDRAFTSELGQSAQGEVFIRAILSMAHALGMSVVAEGVETREQLDILRSLDCNEVQGYLIAKPVTAAQMGAMMRQGNLMRTEDDFPAIQFG